MKEDHLTSSETPEKGHHARKKVDRMTISLPETMLTALDRMVEERKFATRSKVIVDLVHQALLKYQYDSTNNVVVGTISIFYNRSVGKIQSRLADLQQKYIAEVISSLHVHLIENHTLEVILVQGPVNKLKEISDEMVRQRGVVSGHLHVVASLIPPIHEEKAE